MTIEYSKLDAEFTMRMYKSLQPHWQRRVTWSWTNWTVGVWWYKRRLQSAFGIDLGPLEIVWWKV